MTQIIKDMNGNKYMDLKKLSCNKGEELQQINPKINNNNNKYIYL